MSTPKFSIVVPTYKGYPELTRTLANLIYQDEDGMGVEREIIIVSDGEDAKVETTAVPLAQTWADNLGQAVTVKYYATEGHYGHGNYPRALGLTKCTGDWVMFADAGTSYLYTLFGRLAAEITKYPPAELLVWDVALMLDPAPMQMLAARAKAVTLMHGVPYGIAGVGCAVRRDWAQQVPWPTTNAELLISKYGVGSSPSDWVYILQLWQKKVNAGLSLNAIMDQIVWINTCYTIAWGARDERIVRPPMEREKSDLLDKEMVTNTWKQLV